MEHAGAYAVAVAFWLFVAVAAVSGIVADYHKRRLVLEPLRAAIERGQQLDPAIIEKLMAQNRHSEELNPIHLHIGGIITIASGVGVALLSFFISQVRPIAFYPVLGGGLAAICVGVGLVIAAKALARGRQAATARGTHA
jgi:hypothetical protein